MYYRFSQIMNPVFTDNLIHWQQQYGRHDLPWQCADPYKIWLSEIMLQQTQVATVRAYFTRFIERFPTVESLAEAHQDEVLALWAGLGYYSRARNLHHAAQQITQDFDGNFPQSRQELETLKGVGRSTAAAIAAFAFNAREAILDGNVRRVLCRVFALDGDERDRVFMQQLWATAEQLLPADARDMPAYTQGLMDLGATVCTRSKPHCANCPQNVICRAFAEERISELPRKKTAVAVREMNLYWAVIRNAQGDILLEKRPARGIWGGMWCVPCFDTATAFDTFCRAHHLPTPDIGTPFSHRLTHRLLTITPYFFRLPQKTASPKHGQFVPMKHLAQWALPKPLTDLLRQHNQQLP